MRIWLCAALGLVFSFPAHALEALLTPLPQLPERVEACETRPDGLPDGCVVHGTRDISAAWLSGPTKRYTHGVLGDSTEATGLRVETAGGQILSFFLPPEAVFEDLTPRLYDIDGDGMDEIITIKSTHDDGAALVILGVRGGQLQILAEAEPIGASNRWLNPIGAGDFDGDGRVEIAYIQTPHLGGILKLVHWNGTRLDLLQDRYGSSNHAIGSREQGLSAIMDVTGDGVPELIVPGIRRDTLHVVSYTGERLRELVRVELDGPLLSGLIPVDGGLAFQLQMGWSDGEVYKLTFK